MRIESIKITAKDIARCQEFANASVDSSLSHYKRRGQSNREKIIHDIVTGKLGEIAAHRMLRRNGIWAKEPDFEIYDTKGKSFDADITHRQRNFHCKAQSEKSANLYGESWLLQYNGKGYGHTDKLFKHQAKGDYLIPSVVYDTHVDIFGVVPVSLLFERDLLKLPKLKWFHNTKRAVYLDDVKTLSWRERWGLLSEG